MLITTRPRNLSIRVLNTTKSLGYIPVTRLLHFFKITFGCSENNINQSISLQVVLCNCQYFHPEFCVNLLKEFIRTLQTVINQDHGWYYKVWHSVVGEDICDGVYRAFCCVGTIINLESMSLITTLSWLSGIFFGRSQSYLQQYATRVLLV